MNFERPSQCVRANLLEASGGHSVETPVITQPASLPVISAAPHWGPLGLSSLSQYQYYRAGGWSRGRATSSRSAEAGITDAWDDPYRGRHGSIREAIASRLRRRWNTTVGPARITGCCTNSSVVVVVLLRLSSARQSQILA